MQLKLVARFQSREDLEKFWMMSISEQGMRLFSGFGMIPGIIDINKNADGTNKIQNSDGTFHRERTVEKTDKKFVIEMDQFQGSSSHLFSLFQEYWNLSVTEKAITRTFIIQPKNFFAAIINRAIIHPQLKIAMRRNMIAIGKASCVSSFEI